MSERRAADAAVPNVIPTSLPTDTSDQGNVRPNSTAVLAATLWLIALTGACSSARGVDPGVDPDADPSDPPPTSTAPTFEAGSGPGGLTIDRPSGWWAVAETADMLMLVGPEVTSSEHFDGDDAVFMAACGLANVGETPAAAIDVFVESAAVEGFELVEGPGPGELGALDPAETLVATLEYDGGDGQGNLISPALRMLVAAAPGPGGQACFIMARGEQAAWGQLGPVYQRMLGSVR